MLRALQALEVFQEISTWIRLLLIVIGFVAIPLTTIAQTDEIQVYDADIAGQGIFNLMIHTNFTPIGRIATRD